jgi:hypothetical protein
MDRQRFLGIADKMGGGEKTQVATMWTEDDIKEKLQDYVILPFEFWERLRPGQHIRYFTKGPPSKFNSGGFISVNPHTLHGKDKPFILLRNSFKGGVSWVVAYEDIEALYFKKTFEYDLVQLQLAEKISKINDNFKKLKQRLDDIDARLKDRA